MIASGALLGLARKRVAAAMATVWQPLGVRRGGSIEKAAEVGIAIVAVAGIALGVVAIAT
jgi:hypothetical protein